MTEDITLRQKIDSSVSKLADTNNTANESNTLYNFAIHNPFADEPDTMSDFFNGGDRTEQLDEAIHLCQFGNNIALITGDNGIGKTFFLEQACFELSETASCCFISGSMELTSEEIAKDVSTELSMPFATSQTIEQLIDMLDDADALKDVSRFIIIVDDIHLLSEDIIFSLLHLSQLSNSVFHLLASGLPSTLNYLESLEFQEGLIKEIHLFPYSHEETHDYLNFKMKAVGYKGENFFDIETVTQLYRKSAGYPSKINQVAEHYLLSQEQEFTDEEDERSPGLPLWHMVGLVLLIFALILAFFYRGSDSPENTEQIIPIALENNTNSTLEQNEMPDNPLSSNTPTVIEEVQAISNSQDNESEQATSDAITSAVAVIDQGIEGEGAAIEETAEASDKPISNKPTVSTVQTQTEPLENTPVQTPNIEARVTETQVTETEKTATIEPTVDNKPAATTESSTAIAAANATTKPITSTTTQQTEPEAAYTPDEQAVLNWPEGDSTIQVIGALDKTSLEQYVAAQANKKSLRLITILRDGKPWHIVLADHFADNNQAREAIQKLPQNQVNGGPWVRKVSDLKQGIRDIRR